jgi:hypothetical protein
MVEHRVSEQSLEFAVFLLQRPQPLGLVDVETTVFGCRLGVFHL